MASPSLGSALRFSGGTLAAVLAAVFLPMPLLLERVSNFLGHVFLVVFGEHAVGLECAGAVERAFSHYSLALAEEIRQQALIGDPNGIFAVGHLEADLHIVATLDAAFLDEPAKPEAGTRRDVLLSNVGG